MSNVEIEKFKGFIKTDFPVIVLICTLCTLILTWRADERAARADERAVRADERAEALFISQIKPHIEMEPTEVVQRKDFKTHSLLTFEYVNSTGFDAYNVTLDVRFGAENTYIGIWELTATGKSYTLTPRFVKAYERKIVKDIGRDISVIDLPDITVSGEMDLQRIFSDSKVSKEGYLISLRAKWKNELGKSFNATYHHRLQQTKIGSEPTYHFVFESKTGTNQ